MQSKTQPRHILVSGHSGAGKSTVSEALAKKLKMPLLSIDPRHAEGTAFHDLIKRLAAETLAEADSPSVVEGTQLTHLEPEELSNFADRIYVRGNARQVQAQRLARAKARWDEKGKTWTKDVTDRKKKLGKAVYSFHDQHVKNYSRIPGTIKYDWRNANSFDDLLTNLKASREKTAAVRQLLSKAELTGSRGRAQVHIDPAVIDPRVNPMATLAKQAATMTLRKITIRIGFSRNPVEQNRKMSCTEVLQDLLYNCIDASSMLKKCHWNAQGTMFKPLHDFLGSGYELLDSLTDDVAERMATLDSPADSSPAKVAAKSALTALPTKFMQADNILVEMDSRLSTLVDKFKAAISDTEDDPVTSNMLQDMTQRLEKYHWMLRRQNEKRETASKEAAARVLASFIKV